MKTKQPLAHLSERQLLTRFEDFVRRDRHNTACLLAYIAEIDERKIWAKHACSSMFAFCMERFHMSEAMTAKRLWAARTARPFPVVLTMVAAGELHLSGITLLGKHLTDANHRQILARAKHKSSREIEVLVAELAPRPDVPSRVRAMPRKTGCTDEPVETPARCDAHGQGVTGGVPVGATRNEPGGVRIALPGGVQANAKGSEPGTVARAFPDAASAGCCVSRPAFRKSITALAPRRYKIEITVDQDTHDQLRALQDLLRHEFPRADPALIVSRAIELLLDHTLKKKAGLTNREPQSEKAKRAEPTPVKRTRAIPAAIRREVWKRDLGRCAFTDEQGRRCRETSRVEYHHEIPYGKGGGHEAGNVTLRCRAHNHTRPTWISDASSCDENAR